MKFEGFALIALAVFLLLDSSLSIVFGNRYMRWGLEYTPVWYRRLIERIVSLPSAALLVLKFVEMAAGGAFLWFGLKMSP